MLADLGLQHVVAVGMSASGRSAMGLAARYAGLLDKAESHLIWFTPHYAGIRRVVREFLCD